MRGIFATNARVVGFTSITIFQLQKVFIFSIIPKKEWIKILRMKIAQQICKEILLSRNHWKIHRSISIQNNENRFHLRNAIKAYSE